MLFWKHLNQKKIKYGVTYRFLTDEDIGDMVELLEEYPGVCFVYTSAHLKMEGEGAVLAFTYNIYRPGEYDSEALRKDTKFSTMLGDVLMHIIETEQKDEQTRKNNP